MAVIHHTTLSPTKLELLAPWLPTRPWYAGSATPVLARSGGFRLDDPQGEVGIEFMVVTDTSGAGPVAYFVPLTYRGAPLDGAEDALVGTTEHGVLGKRWVYDGGRDPVVAERLFALLDGRAEPQAQSETDTPDPTITHSRTGGPIGSAVAAVTEGPEGTDLAVTGATLHLNRVLRPDAPLPEGATGHVSGPWRTPEDVEVRGAFAVLRTA
ncbi:1,4-alpha-glucan branching protein [Streptomyces sp. SID9124]|uniref:maltokinase N-terminal cap-like domain-containing protein n=1 Tax=Streptomyces sp. SID9124 TaxID=2706108 RepID=UPI0013E02F17|nr:1,4-alpha-glucan branching protein [Streptomyces sp. SID9124]NED13795.1 1,4-alpha-glucan branching protein [Streptomyces sp. SID9124]